MTNPSTLPQASHDAQVIELWVHGRSPSTQRAYRADAQRLIQQTGLTLHQIQLEHLQVFADSLRHLAPTSQQRTLSAIKSLFHFATRIGYTPHNVAAMLRLPVCKNTLAERILTEEQVQRILALEPNPRTHCLIRLLYASGGRVSEIMALHWRDAQPRFRRDGQADGGQITLHGKGGKTRTVLLSTHTWHELIQWGNTCDSNTPIFGTPRGPLSASQGWRLVKAAAARAGLPDVSPQWFRHAHASHALDRGAPITLVRDTLGHADIATTGKYLHARPEDSSSRYLGI